MELESVAAESDRRRVSAPALSRIGPTRKEELRQSGRRRSGLCGLTVIGALFKPTYIHEALFSIQQLVDGKGQTARGSGSAAPTGHLLLLELELAHIGHIQVFLVLPKWAGRAARAQVVGVEVGWRAGCVTPASVAVVVVIERQLGLVAARLAHGRGTCKLPKGITRWLSGRQLLARRVEAGDQ